MGNMCTAEQKEQFEDKVEDAVDAAKEVAKDIKEKVEETVEQAKEVAEDVKEKVEEMVEPAKEAAADAVEAAKKEIAKFSQQVELAQADTVEKVLTLSGMPDMRTLRQQYGVQAKWVDATYTLEIRGAEADVAKAEKFVQDGEASWAASSKPKPAAEAAVARKPKKAEEYKGSEADFPSLGGGAQNGQTEEKAVPAAWGAKKKEDTPKNQPKEVAYPVLGAAPARSAEPKATPAPAPVAKAEEERPVEEEEEAEEEEEQRGARPERIRDGVGPDTEHMPPLQLSMCVPLEQAERRPRAGRNCRLQNPGRDLNRQSKKTRKRWEGRFLSRHTQSQRRPLG